MSKKEINKEEIQKDKPMKCCDKCWNNKYALTNAQKKKFKVCGITCECHKKQWDKKELIIKSNYDKPEDMEMICEKHNCDIRKCDECFKGNEKYPALENHICRFNDGECICDCFDEGYQQAVKEERERLVEILENYDLSNCTNDYQFGFNKAKELLTNRW
jgi:hypothetical protein